jgi:hypothetical protein
MLFYPFFVLPAFRSANDNLPTIRQLPNWLGPIVLVAGLTDVVLTYILTLYSENWSINWNLSMFVVGIIVLLIAILPTVKAVLYLNEEKPEGKEVIQLNSRFNLLNILAILFFPILFWVIYFQ